MSAFVIHYADYLSRGDCQLPPQMAAISPESRTVTESSAGLLARRGQSLGQCAPIIRRRLGPLPAAPR